MKSLRPDFFDRFRCTAGHCRHTCCAGWEIDVDDASYERYGQLPGEFGKRVRNSITRSADGSRSFRLTKDERCVFLDENNLCEIIRNCGEDALCDICRLHPRFYHFYQERTELGLGLCCEETSRLLLSSEEPLGFLAGEEENESAEEWFDEEEEVDADTLFYVREKLFRLLSDRSLSLSERLTALEKEARRHSVALLGMPDTTADFPVSDEKILLLMQKTEPIDDQWVPYTKAILERLPEIRKRELDFMLAEPGYDAGAERVLTYLLFRHFVGAASDGRILGRVRFCILSLRFLKLCDMDSFLREGGMSETSRIDNLARWSSQTEYSDQNIDMLLQAL